MKTILAWLPRLVATALLLGLLLGILAVAHGQPPTAKQKARARAALALVRAAPYAPKYPTVCPCSGKGNCTCEPARCICEPCSTQPVPKMDPFNDPNRPWTRPATDGGSSWQWDCHRGAWYRPLPAAPLFPSMSPMPMPPMPSMGFRSGGGGGVC